MEPSFHAPVCHLCVHDPYWLLTSLAAGFVLAVQLLSAETVPSPRTQVTARVRTAEAEQVEDHGPHEPAVQL